MPRYFFDTRDGGIDRDANGTELPDRDAARCEAVRFAGAMLANEPSLLHRDRDFRVEVTDEARALVCTILVLAIDVRPAPTAIAGTEP